MKNEENDTIKALRVYSEVQTAAILAYSRRFSNLPLPLVIGLVSQDAGAFYQRKSMEIIEKMIEDLDLCQVFEELGRILANRIGSEDDYQKIRENVKVIIAGEING
jgi:hypothetical protein